MNTRPNKTVRTKNVEAFQQPVYSEMFFRSLYAHSLDGILITDDKGFIRFASPSVKTILGYEPEELVGTIAFQHIHPDDLKSAMSAFFDEVNGNPKVKFISVRLHKKSGDWLWCVVRGHNLLDVEHIQGVAIYFYDDTLRRKAKDELIESERRLRYHEEEFKKLSRQLIEQEIHKQKLLTQATIDGQEKERLEMGKELHDNINQHLNTTRLYLEVAREKATGEVKEMINFSHKSLAGIIDKIRFLSQSLVPPTLGDIGLVESIQDICDALRRTHKFKIDFLHRQFDEEGLPANMLLMLFRITQEQVNNIIRHAEASHIDIRLESDAEYVILTIADNGKGFDPLNYKKGLGITNITNRASLFNGKVEIEAAQDKGCKLTVIIPLEPNSNHSDQIA